MRFAFAVFALLPVAAIAETHPFNVHDLVMMDRVSDPQISPDGKRVAYQLRETDYAGNKGVNSVWIVDHRWQECRAASTFQEQAELISATSPRWSPDGKSVCRARQVEGRDARRCRRLSFDKDAKGGSKICRPTRRRRCRWTWTVSSCRQMASRSCCPLAVFSDCSDLACTKKRLDEKSASKASGQLFDKLFIRHWDTWANGTRSQLFIADVPAERRRRSQNRAC